jgi:hypothetical protein
MSKLALGLVVAGIAAMPFVDKGDKSDMPNLAYAETFDAAPLNSNQTVYVVASQGGAMCKIVNQLDQHNDVVVKADNNCAAVHDGLERVTSWVSGTRGNDMLKDASGKTILVVGPSDGFAFEAVSYSGAQISFALSGV